MGNTTIDSLADRIMQALPPGLSALSDDIKYIIRDMIKDQLLKLDLVPREEFDTQCGVLKRCQDKLHDLEQKLMHLEDKNRDD